MLRRLGWIAVSYVTRPLFLMFFGTGLLVLATNALDGPSNPRYGTDYPQAVVATGPTAMIQIIPQIMSVTFLAIGIGLSLASQFRGPLCRLAPGFVVSHAWVAGMLLSAVVLVGVTSLRAMGYQPLASAIVVTALATTVVSSACGNRRAPPKEQGLRQAAVAWGKLALLLCVVGPLFVPNTADAILSGQEPGVLVLLGMVTLVSGVLAVTTLGGLSTASTTTSFLAREGFQRRMLLESQAGSGWLVSARRERWIDGWAKNRVSWTWWNRVLRWRGGNVPFRSVMFMLIVLGIMLLALRVFGSLFPSGSGSKLQDVRGQIIVSAGLMAFGAAGQVAIAWRVRMLVLPLEVLRPYDRRAMQNEMAVAFIVDMIRPVLVAAAIVAIALNLDASLHSVWVRLPIGFLIFAAVGLTMAVGLGAVVVVVKRDWLLLIVVLVTFLATFSALAWLVVRQFANPTALRRELTPGVVEAQLWLPVVVGVGLAWVMWRRWLVMEVDSRV